MTRISPLYIFLVLGLASLSLCPPGWADESAVPLQDSARTVDRVGAPVPGSTAAATPIGAKSFDPPEVGRSSLHPTARIPWKPEPVPPTATGPASWITTFTELVSSLLPRKEDLDNAIQSPTGMYRNPRKGRTDGNTWPQPAEKH